MTKSKSETKQTATVAPSSYNQPYINDAAATLKPAYETAQQNINQNLVPAVNRGLDYYGDVTDGKYLRGNPFLEGVINESNRGVTDGVSSQFSSAGRYGSGRHADILARALAENENRLRYGDYAQERQYQNDAPRGTAGLAGVSASLPQGASDAYARQIAGLLGGYNTSSGQSSTKSTIPLGPLLLQAGASAAQAVAASDRRLKTNIEKIGELADGLGVYLWNYVWGGPRMVGSMADEVEALRPWALGPVVGGYQTVCYGRL